MKIVKFPNPILRERMPEFDFDNPSHNPVQLEKELIETMFQEDGIGLAANQAGIRARVFVMGYKNQPESARAYFNPIIVNHVDELYDQIEGCLSFPGIFVKVKRPKKIKARWQNSLGEWQEGIFENYECKCFLHEFDHLEGIVFKDRISELKWALEIKKNKRTNK